MSFEQIIAQGLDQWGLAYDQEGLGRLQAFCGQLLETNRVMNLTAITEPSQVAVKHMLDSLFLLTIADLDQGRSIDIGCGAGFPSLPLKLMRPELDVTMLDSTAKRIAFVERMAQSQGVQVRAVAARAEEFVAKAGERESYDFALSRAVAPLAVLAELSLPYLKVGGLFLPMKSTGPAAEEEIAQAARALELLGGQLIEQVEYELPGVPGARQVLIIEKARPTPAKYPRRYAKIAAGVLGGAGGEVLGGAGSP